MSIKILIVEDLAFLMKIPSDKFSNYYNIDLIGKLGIAKKILNIAIEFGITQ